MTNLTRIIIFGEMIFIVGSFLSAVLQSYNHFFIPGIAAALYNLGIIIGILFFHGTLGLYSAPVGRGASGCPSDYDLPAMQRAHR